MQHIVETTPLRHPRSSGLGGNLNAAAPSTPPPVSFLHAAADVRVWEKPMMLWAAAGVPLGSRVQRGRWIGVGDHRLVAGLAGGRRGGVHGRMQGGDLERWFLGVSRLAALAWAAAAG
jgi:hypothetical protein